MIFLVFDHDLLLYVPYIFPLKRNVVPIPFLRNKALQAASALQGAVESCNPHVLRAKLHKESALEAVGFYTWAQGSFGVIYNLYSPSLKPALVNRLVSPFVQKLFVARKIPIALSNMCYFCPVFRLPCSAGCLKLFDLGEEGGREDISFLKNAFSIVSTIILMESL